MRSFLILALLSAPPAAIDAQDRHDWQSLAQLQAGDRIRLSLKTGPVTGVFQTWTPEQVTAGTVIAKKDDVLKIERYRSGGSGRGKKAAIGALIGFGGGFAIGAGATGGLSPGPVWSLHLARTRGRDSRRRRRAGRRRNRRAASNAWHGTYLFSQVRMGNPSALPQWRPPRNSRRPHQA